jgi:hypothetical protein
VEVVIIGGVLESKDRALLLCAVRVGNQESRQYIELVSLLTCVLDLALLG